jgi:hypothetical protein
MYHHRGTDSILPASMIEKCIDATLQINRLNVNMLAHLWDQLLTEKSATMPLDSLPALQSSLKGAVVYDTSESSGNPAKATFKIAILSLIRSHLNLMHLSGTRDRNSFIEVQLSNENSKIIFDAPRYVAMMFISMTSLKFVQLAPGKVAVVCHFTVLFF